MHAVLHAQVPSAAGAVNMLASATSAIASVNSFPRLGWLPQIPLRALANVLCAVVVGGAQVSCLCGEERWRQHDRQRPHPPIMTPAAPQEPAAPPSDAIVLFDGTDLSQWQQPGGGTTKWIVKDGAMMPTPDSGPIESRQGFGDLQLHLEWQAPKPSSGTGQGRGNSGVYLMSKYELQILDSFNNETYADGQAAAIYGQSPPLVNACRPPGQWQTYDVIFHAPRFDDAGVLKAPATMTVLHNGILVQDHFSLTGGTMWLQTLPYTKHDAELPISLQDHGNPVRFRNIWARPLAPSPQARVGKKTIASSRQFDHAPLDPYAGKFRSSSGEDINIDVHQGHLRANFFGMSFDFVRTGENTFESDGTDLGLEYSGDQQSLRMSIMGDVREATRIN
jgi:hypothetical protein